MYFKWAGDLPLSDHYWLSESQLFSHIGAKQIYPAKPNAKAMIGDKGYDSDEFPETLNARKIKVCRFNFQCLVCVQQPVFRRLAIIARLLRDWHVGNAFEIVFLIASDR
jgi:hypothetical protein